MKVRITANAPTRYQLGALRAFGIEVTQLPNGSFEVWQTFDTAKQAKVYLTMRANYYFENATDLKTALNEIKKHHSLTIDSVTATIQKCKQQKNEKNIKKLTNMCKTMQQNIKSSLSK